MGDALNEQRNLGSRARVGLLLAAGASVAIRLPFLHAPISGDEGGYAAAATRWARGHELYAGPVLDRPQLLAVVYRIANAMTPRDIAGIRVLAIVFGVLTTLLLGVVAFQLTASGRCACSVAVVYAVVGSSPALEAFSAYGELLAGVPALGAISLYLRWRTHRQDQKDWLLIASGALGVAAIGMKQSGFDGLAVIICALFISLVRERARSSLRPLALVLGGATVTVLAFVIHGAQSGLALYWNSIVGYRLRYLSAVGGADDKAALLTGSLRRIAPLLIAVSVLSVVGIVRSSRQTRWFVTGWFGWTIAGFLSGGLFWLHYFMGPILPLCMFAGLGLESVLRTAHRNFLQTISGLIVAVLAATLVFAQNATALRLASRRNGDERVLEIDHRYKLVANYLRTHTTGEETIQPLWQSGAVSWYADRKPASRYMWATWFHSMPGALADLADLLSKRSGPTYVTFIHPIDILKDTPGFDKVKAALAQHYHLETTVEDVPILRRNA